MWTRMHSPDYASFRSYKNSQHNHTPKLRTSAVVISFDDWTRKSCLLVRDQITKEWGFPTGGIKENTKERLQPINSALRELEEETCQTFPIPYLHPETTSYIDETKFTLCVDNTKYVIYCIRNDVSDEKKRMLEQLYVVKRSHIVESTKLLEPMYSKINDPYLETCEMKFFDMEKLPTMMNKWKVLDHTINHSKWATSVRSAMKQPVTLWGFTPNYADVHLHKGSTNSKQIIPSW